MMRGGLHEKLRHGHEILGEFAAMRAFHALQAQGCLLEFVAMFFRGSFACALACLRA